jgi:fibronectin-binding autotransporter adhesin
VVAGAYGYRLYQGGTVPRLAATGIFARPCSIPPAPRSCHSMRPVCRSTKPMPACCGASIGTLRQRIGGREGDGQSANDAGNGPARAIWTRIDGTHSHFEPEIFTTGTEYDVNGWRAAGGRRRNAA